MIMNFLNNSQLICSWF